MSNALTNSTMFLVNILFYLYIVVMLLRLMLQYVGANYYNPISQFVVRATSPVLKPLQRFIPRFRGVDLAIVVVLLALTMMKLSALTWIKLGLQPPVTALLVLSTADLLNTMLSLYSYILIGRVILSWIQSPQLGPLSEILFRLTEAPLQRIRRLLPPMGGFDLSPIVLLIIVQLIMIFLGGTLHAMGVSML